MKVLIVDDEAPARERLKRLVEELEGAEVAGEAEDGQAALASIHEGRPEVVLMDIRMPGMDGLEAARHLAKLEEPPAVIFTTAYGEHALEAFEAEAVDYLLKPVRKQRLEQALARAARLTRAQADALGEKTANRRTHLSSQFQGRLRLIPVTEVIYFQADHKYVTAYYHDGEAVLEESLKALEEEFGDAFVRIHRNALVSRQALEGMTREPSGHYRALLRNTGNRPEISRRHAAEVKEILKRQS